MYSQIVERTPSIYFKFDDQSHKNFSKSSLAFDYSISNQKAVLTNNRFQRYKNNSSNKQKTQNKNNMITSFKKLYNQANSKKQQDGFMVLFGCQNNEQQDPTQKIKTQQIFQQFHQKFLITFDGQQDIEINQWNDQISFHQRTSKISRGNLGFQQIQIEQNDKLIPIDFKNLQTKTQINLFKQQNPQSPIDINEKNERLFQTQIFSNQMQKNPFQNIRLKNSSSLGFSDKQNQSKNMTSQFQEIISFGPVQNTKSQIRKYKASNHGHFMTKDFQNNSSLLQKSQSKLTAKRRKPLKSIQNILQKNSQERNKPHTRKKPIINPDLLLVSTINKNQQYSNCNNQTNCIWSDPINKKSSSLESTFSFNNMFKTNSFRQTLKSTTLQNWKKKYHMKIQKGEKKTVHKKQRDINIFDKLFIRV